MKRFVIVATLLLVLSGCSKDGGADFIRHSQTFDGVVPANLEANVGIISPSTIVEKVEVAPASDPTAFVETFDYFFPGVHHGGVLPGVVILRKASPGDKYRVTVK